MDVSKAVGERIRKHRIMQGLTQEALAEKAGLHHTYIGQLERGEKNATLESIQKVATGLAISFEDLFENLSPKKDDAKIATKCYELIYALPLEEQQKIYEIIKKTIEYKNS